MVWLILSKETTVKMIWAGPEFMIRRRLVDISGNLDTCGFDATFFQGKKVLDVGCGVGYLVSDLIYKGADAFGVDLAYTIDELRDQVEIEQSHLNQKIQDRIIGIDAIKLPFPDAQFDFVFNLNGAISYTDSPQELIVMIEEQLRVLKPGGYIYIDPVIFDCTNRTCEVHNFKAHHFLDCIETLDLSFYEFLRESGLGFRGIYSPSRAKGKCGFVDGFMLICNSKA